MKPKRRFDERPPSFRPVAVVDIGSNTIRLVAYDGLRRTASPVFNEKIACALGRGVAVTGELPEDGVERALSALRRFRAIGEQVGAERFFAVATAAVREATNGKAFIRHAQEALGCRIQVLTGREEARYAALGVIAGIRDANGIVGDLGGGSLELVDIRNGEIRDGVTLPLGPLRLMDLADRSIKKARSVIDEALCECPLVEHLHNRPLYAVGGAWRNLARLQMAQTKYPLNVIHHFRMQTDAARSVAALVAGLSPASLKDIPAVSRSRSETLPYGALVMERLLQHGRASEVVMSVFGVREGLLYSKLSKRKRDSDPLLAACWDFARRYARSPKHELELCDWTDQLFEQCRIAESDVDRRLRHAACMLADIGWRSHPDYRGSRSLSMISQAAFVGVDHPGRVFLALTVYFRYEGANSSKAPADLLRLMHDDDLDRARIVASAMRLAYVLTAAMPGMLPNFKLRSQPSKILELQIPEKLADLAGETVEKRLTQLSDLVGRTGRLVIG